MIRTIKNKMISANTPTQRVLFAHVPKCGGSSVVETLREEFGRGRFLKKSYTFGLDPAASRVAARISGIDMQIARSSLLAYQLEISKARFIYGHFALPQGVIDKFSEKWSIVTILREPKSRLLSEYYYNRYKQNHEHFGTELELEAWLETPDARHAATSFLRYFCGRLEDARFIMENCHDTGALKDQISASKRNLRAIDVVGSIENTAGFEKAIQEKLGRTITLPQKNKSPQKNYAKYQDQSTGIQRKIDEICAGDSLLYTEHLEAQT